MESRRKFKGWKKDLAYWSDLGGKEAHGSNHRHGRLVIIVIGWQWALGVVGVFIATADVMAFSFPLHPHGEL